MANGAERKNLSAEEKRSLLLDLLKKGAHRTRPTLTAEQERLWFLARLTPHYPPHACLCIALDGRLDVAVLQQSVADLSTGHESLRTSFVDLDGSPCRLVSPATQIVLPMEDFSESVDEDGAATLVEALRAHASRPFDVSTGPLFRTTLLRLAPERHLLLFVLHRIIADRASIAALYRDFSRTYASLAGHSRRSASVRGHELSEFVSERERFLDQDFGRKLLERAAARVKGLANLRLIGDFPRPPLATFAGEVTRTSLPPSLVKRLRVLAERENVDFSTVVLTAFALLLSRHGRASDVAIGVPVSLRGGSISDDVVGPFESVGVVRLKVDPTLSLTGLLAAAAEAERNARDEGRIPFARLVEAARPDRDQSRNPLFQVWFRNRRELEPVRIGDLVVSEYSFDDGMAMYDLELELDETVGGDVSLRLVRNTALFGDAIAGRLLHQLRVLLENCVESPGTCVGVLSMLDSAERDTVVSRWNDTQRDVGAGRSIASRVAAHAQQSPNSVAVTCGEMSLSYGELDRLANRIANHLSSAGIGPEDRVAIVSDRSAHAIAAILGVMKAGAAYVPIDGTMPMARVRSLIEKADVKAILTERAFRRTLPRIGELVVIDGDRPELIGPPEAIAESELRDRLAYVIFTSGSTGEAKGVMIAHAQLENAILARNERFPLPTGGYLAMAPLAFDASGAGVFWTLVNGRHLVLPTAKEVLDPRLLAQTMARSKVSHFDGVPSQYELMLDSQPQALSTLSCCILAGEAMPPALVARHLKAAPRAALINEYGPTEAAIWASSFTCDAAAAHRPSVPIGRPHANGRIYVLDPEFRPAAIGVPGELYIGGAGVARGYLGDPQLTAERFVPDPFSAEPGQRLYRTGDLARFLVSGDLEFLGRTDDQIKIRGNRVEPSEIEHQLRQHPSVWDAAVVPRTTGGALRLVGFVTGSGGDELAEELHQFMTDRLPAYMVPSEISILDHLPLTANGKTDRVALSIAPLRGRTARSAESLSELQNAVTKDFEEILGTAQVGLDDNFFKLGGHSLLVVRLATRLSEIYNVSLPVTQVFDRPTVRAICKLIQDLQSEQGVHSYLTVETLYDDVHLDESIRPNGTARADQANPSEVLLTGATGYLGAFMLEELLSQTNASITCLVRAPSVEAARQRVIDRRAEWKLSTKLDPDRVRFLPGDLSLPNLGLTASDFAELGSRIDAIYSCGAVVNFIFPYSAVKSANVDGTRELLRLATLDRLKAVHHVSSVDTLIGPQELRPFLERDLPERPRSVPDGYARSKWIAEKIVTIARARGVPVTIYRPAVMMGHSITGASHTTDYLIVALKGFLRLGILPDYNDMMNTMPVDFAAAAIVKLSLDPRSVGQTIHVFHPDPIPTSASYPWVRSFGYDFEVVPLDVAVDRATHVDMDHPLYPIIPLWQIDREFHRDYDQLDPDVNERIETRAECANLLRGLEGTGIVCPPIDEKYFHTLLAYLVDIGYLEQPRVST